MSRQRILLADDRAVLRPGIRMLLDLHGASEWTAYAIENGLVSR